MNYEQLNLEYRWAIIKIVDYLTTESDKQERRISSAKFNQLSDDEYLKDAELAMEKINKMLDLPVPTLPPTMAPPRVLAHYRACLQLNHILRTSRLKRDPYKAKTIMIEHYISRVRKSLSDFLAIFMTALQEADSILPNPLAETSGGNTDKSKVADLEAELYSKNCEIQRLKDKLASITKTLSE